MKSNRRQAASAWTFVVVATTGLLTHVKPALAEFQIQEAGIEKGEAEVEYRGAYHWGVPQVTDIPFSGDLREWETLIMTTVGYARVSSTGQDLEVQLEKLKGCEKVFKEKRSGVDAGRPELKRCLEYLREGDTLLVTKIDRLARSTSDLYRIISLLADKGVAFKVLDDPSIDTTSRTGKLVMGILALIAEFENDIRRERQMDGIAKAKERGTRFGPKPQLTAEKVKEIRELRKDGNTVPEIMRHTKLSKSSVYRALGAA